MARRQYETEADRVREAGVIGRVTDKITGSTAEKLQYGSRADYRISVNGVPSAYVEIKTRTCTSKTYQTYHVSHDKLKALMAMAERDGLKPLLLVQWTDKVGVISVGKYLEHATFKRGGRTDRGDHFDIEQMAEVAISRFTFI